MKIFKHYLFIAAALITMISFTSCDDKDEIVDNLVGAYGKVWEGDLGALSDNDYPLISRLTFRENGKGREELYYMDNGEFYNEYNFNWEFNWDNSILIFYRNGDNAYISNYIISETYFKGYWSFNDSPTIPFELRAR